MLESCIRAVHCPATGAARGRSIVERIMKQITCLKVYTDRTCPENKLGMNYASWRLHILCGYPKIDKHEQTAYVYLNYRYILLFFSLKEFSKF